MFVYLSLLSKTHTEVLWFCQKLKVLFKLKPLKLKVSVLEKPLDGTSVLQQIQVGIKYINPHFYTSFKDLLECLTYDLKPGNFVLYQ